MGEIWDYINRTIVATEYLGNRTVSAGALETIGAGVLGELATGMTAGGVAAAMSASNQDCNVWALLYSNNDLENVAVKPTDRKNNVYNSYPNISTYMAEHNLEWANEKCTKIQPASSPKLEESDSAEPEGETMTTEEAPLPTAEFTPMPSFEELFPVNEEEKERERTEGAANADPKTTDINADNDATIISDGTYLFGENIPEGAYDLFLVKGSGNVFFLDKKMKRNYSDCILLSFEKDRSSVYRGLSSTQWIGFEINGGPEIRIARAQTIEIK